MLNVLFRKLRGTRRYRRMAELKLGQSLLRTSGYLVAIFAVHTGAMMGFEGLGLGDALWLTLTTATTVGYGDISAATAAGRFATAILLYAGGIFVLAKLAGDYFDYRADVRARMERGDWEWEMQDHIVIINSPQSDAVNYFELLVGHFRSTDDFADVPIQIVTRAFSDGLPAALSDLGEVVHYNGAGEAVESLRAARVDQARAVIVLARSDRDPASDSATFDILHRLRDEGCTCRVLAECVRDSNRERFARAGADIVIRPIRAYPGMLVRGVVSPGAQRLMEALFRSDNGEYRRVEVALENLLWADVVARVIRHDLGVALAYETVDGELRVSPHADERITGTALFVVIDAHVVPTSDQVAAALADTGT